MRESCIAGTIIHNWSRRRGTTANWRTKSQSSRNRQLQKLQNYDSREKLAFPSFYEETMVFWVELAYVLLRVLLPSIFHIYSLLSEEFSLIRQPIEIEIYEVWYFILDSRSYDKTSFLIINIHPNYLKHQLVCHISTDVLKPLHLEPKKETKIKKLFNFYPLQRNRQK